MDEPVPQPPVQVEPGKVIPAQAEWTYSKGKVRVGLITTLTGFLIFLIGLHPAWFGFASRPGVGFIKISVFLIGLGLICLGGYLSLAALWKRGTFSIAADVGMRLIATGYLISVFSGMADVFGFGSQLSPMVPSFGRWQASGVEIGELVIAVGLLLLIPYNIHRKTSA